jgi:peroxiredoxin Q/BCP
MAPTKPIPTLDPLIGSQAPALRGQSQLGPFDLVALRGQPVVVYFYPKDSTPGCTTEAQDFRDHLIEFRALGAQVVGVSKDTVASHLRFATKELLTFTLLSDATGEACLAWGVWQEKTLYGKTSMGIVRSTFLVGADGNVVNVWRKVRVKGHVEEVLSALRAIAPIAG